MKSVLRLSLVLCLLAAAGCARQDDAEWRRWARWGMTDAEVTAASGGRAPVPSMAVPGHIVISEPQLQARLPVRQNGVLFDAILEFDPRTRRLHTVVLRLTGAAPCADLLDNTLARHGPADQLRRGSVGRSGMYTWAGRPFEAGFSLNYRPWDNRAHDCFLIYNAPGFREKTY